MNLKAMFEDQRSFNLQIYRPSPVPEMMDRLRHLSLGMVEETLEFLRTYEWKSHRRHKGKLQNVAHSHEELVDMFKYWLSIADIADFPIEQLEELYYAKSRVVQYRYQEEWLKEINGPCVLVDIDNVLADYITGICAYARNNGQSLLGLSNVEAVQFALRLNDLQSAGAIINAESVRQPHDRWQILKHEFRTTGGKQFIPVFDDARPFLDWCHASGLIIILVTSRPIDRYPNIFTDTMTWLHNNHLPYDYLWWADDKARRLEEYEHASSLRSHVRFAVDDDMRFVNQYREKGIKTYWLTRHGDPNVPDPNKVYSLTQIVKKEGEEDGRLR